MRPIRVHGISSVRQNLRKTKIKKKSTALFSPNYLQPRTFSLRNFNARKRLMGNRSFVPSFPTKTSSIEEFGV